MFLSSEPGQSSGNDFPVLPAGENSILNILPPPRRVVAGSSTSYLFVGLWAPTKMVVPVPIPESSGMSGNVHTTAGLKSDGAFAGIWASGRPVEARSRDRTPRNAEPRGAAARDPRLRSEHCSLLPPVNGRGNDQAGLAARRDTYLSLDYVSS